MDLLRHISRALASGKEHSTTVLGPVSDTAVRRVRDATGIDLRGFRRIMQSSDIRHVFNSHGDVAAEDARGQEVVRKSDFVYIPTIVEQAHAIRAIGQRGAAKPQRLEYIANIGQHEYRYVEEIRPNRLVALKAMRKRLI